MHSIYTCFYSILMCSFAFRSISQPGRLDGCPGLGYVAACPCLSDCPHPHDCVYAHAVAPSFVFVLVHNILLSYFPFLFGQRPLRERLLYVHPFIYFYLHLYPPPPSRPLKPIPDLASKTQLMPSCWSPAQAWSGFWGSALV